ncbi:hypothetical protein CEE39_02445 [bacterium (candidate division B38) B3_B38]|nr:MAG: hypothetical protein CEE39_02445 [bacterium (candidate division B38) B3_B38]
MYENLWIVIGLILVIGFFLRHWIKISRTTKKRSIKELRTNEFNYYIKFASNYEKGRKEEERGNIRGSLLFYQRALNSLKDSGKTRDELVRLSIQELEKKIEKLQRAEESSSL